MPEIAYERVRETATASSLSFDEVLAQSLALSLPELERDLNLPTAKAGGFWDQQAQLVQAPVRQPEGLSIRRGKSSSLKIVSYDIIRSGPYWSRAALQ